MPKTPSLRFRLYFVFVFSLISLVLSAQSSLDQEQIDKLESRLENEKLSENEEGEILLELIKLYENTGDFKRMADRSISYFQLPTTDFSSLLSKNQVIKDALKLEGKIEDSTIIGNLHLKLAGGYFDLNEFDSAFNSYSTALIKFKTTDTLFLADTYFFRGQVLDASSNMIDAMLDYQKALDLYEAAGDEDYAGFTKAGMAVLFSKYAIYEEADEIREELMQRDLREENWESLGVQYFNRATDLGKKENWPGQVENLLIADSLLRRAESRPFLLLQSNLALSRAFGKSGNLDSQREYFQKAGELMLEVPEIKESSTIYLMTKARLSFAEGKYKQAEQECKQLLESANQKGDFDEFLYGYELLAETQKKLGKMAEALATYERFKSYKDSIFVANQATSFAYYQALYDTEKKEVEILRKEAEVQGLITSNRENTIRFVGILGAVLLIGGLVFLYSNLRAEQKKKALQEKFAQELLRAQEEERKRISKDLHDGLGQSLLLIKNKVALQPGDHTGEMLDTAINELRSIARSLHPMQLEKLGLGKAIEQMLDQIDEETELFVSADITLPKDLIPKETELQLYRIAQEVLNNVLKHSEAKALRFNLSEEVGKIKMTIEDNGKGFDFSERYNDFQSLGLKTLKERTASIRGRMNVQSEKGKGSKFEFILNV